MEENIKKHYNNVNNESDIVNIPIRFRRNFLGIKNNDDSNEIIEAPIIALRIIIKCLDDVSFDQYYENGNNTKQKDLTQISLFEDEFKTVNNTYAVFTFKIKTISTSNDYEGVKKGLEFLENYKKGWYTSLNKEGKEIKSFGGFILNPSMSKGEISFMVSSYWLESILSLSSGYNPALKQTVWKFTNTKHMIFYLWLLELKTNTSVFFDKFQIAFNYNYKNPNDFTKNFLKPIKKKLDQFSNKSFNYSVENNKINIIPYFTKNIKLEINKETEHKQFIKQKLEYWKKRHNLSEESISRIHNCLNLSNDVLPLMNDAYKLMVKDYRIKKKKLTSSKNTDFIISFQEYIKIAYNKTIWASIIKNGHPII